MQYKEFYQYVQELQNFYDKKLNEKELEVWYENLKFMTIERFNYIIAEIYKTNPFLPKLSEILAIHRSIPYKVTTQVEEVKGICKKCNNTGYIIYTKVIDEHDYKFCAVCNCGRQARYDGTKVADPKNQSKYYIPTLAETGLEIKENRPANEEIISSMKKLANSPIISENIKNIIRENFRKRRVNQ